MAAANSLATAFLGAAAAAKAEPFRANRTSNSTASPAFSFRVYQRGVAFVGSRRGAVRRSPRCEVQVDIKEKAAASISAIEQFKISADRKFKIFPLCFDPGNLICSNKKKNKKNQLSSYFIDLFTCRYC